MNGRSQDFKMNWDFVTMGFEFDTLIVVSFLVKEEDSWSSTCFSIFVLNKYFQKMIWGTTFLEFWPSILILMRY